MDKMCCCRICSFVAAIFFLSVFVPQVLVAEPLTLYIAPEGNDAWTGTLAVPDPAANDGPLATVYRARDIVRDKLQQNALPEGARIVFRQGTYVLPEPLVLTPADSGKEGAPIVYERFGEEKVTLSGGVVIKEWRVENGRWIAPIPDVGRPDFEPTALYINGKRRQPARTPNCVFPWGDEPQETDTFRVDALVMENAQEGGQGTPSTRRFVFKEGDLAPYTDLAQAVVVVYHSWATSLLRIADLDSAARIVSFTGDARWPFGNWEKQQRYYVERTIHALDQPGEWAIDRTSRTVQYLPMPGEDPGAVQAVVPVLTQLLVLAGNPAENKYVEHVHFRGIRFFHTAYPIPPQGISDPQAAVSVNAVVEAVGARNCRFESCRIAHTDNYGLWLRAGCRQNQVVRCELDDLGAGGVRIGEASDPTGEHDVVSHNTVDNCLLFDGGKVFREAVGVWIGRSSYNTISHCDIGYFRYTGVSVGWSWGYAPSSANHNVIADNHIHHIGLGQLADLGAIYTLGISPGTVLRGNLIHDIMSYKPLYGGWGIYFDEGSTEIVAENNLVFRTRTGNFHQHYGKENRVQNNIFAYSEGPQLVRSREEEHISFYFERNIVLFDNGNLLGSTWKNNQFRMDNNVYWDESGQEVRFAGKTLAEWQALGQDVHSQVADPLFVNPREGDFRLKPESPALALGFQAFDISTAGLYGDQAWIERPAQKLASSDLLKAGTNNATPNPTP